MTSAKKAPNNERKINETIRNEWAYKAHRSLKQARRAEQIIYRSEAMMGTEKGKRKTHEDLNKDAAKLIIKNVKKGGTMGAGHSSKDAKGVDQRKVGNHGNASHQKGRQ